jgi:hypothetical protein
MPYSPNWPKCPVCGDDALDGKLTCGRVACMDHARRVQRLERLTCLAYLDDGRLCGEPATTVDPERGMVVCLEHAPHPHAPQYRR